MDKSLHREVSGNRNEKLTLIKSLQHNVHNIAENRTEIGVSFDASPTLI